MELTKAAGLTMQEIVQELIRSGHGAVQTREKVRDFVGDPTRSEERRVGKECSG